MTFSRFCHEYDVRFAPFIHVIRAVRFRPGEDVSRGGALTAVTFLRAGDAPQDLGWRLDLGRRLTRHTLAPHWANPAEFPEEFSPGPCKLPEQYRHIGLLGAVEKTRTSTAFRPQRPQRCASTSSATTARHEIPGGKVAADWRGAASSKGHWGRQWRPIRPGSVPKRDARLRLSLPSARPGVTPLGWSSSPRSHWQQPRSPSP